jgi:hypothetical protein
MANISRTSIHQALDRAAKTILSAAGPDGRASRTDMTRKLKELTGTEKALVDTFYKFIDHRDAGSGAAVTKTDVTKALALAKQKLIDAYDLDKNGLSPDEVAKMSKVGQLASQIAQIYKQPTIAAQAAANVLVSPKWAPDALPALPVDQLSHSARVSFDARTKAAARNDLLTPPIARKLTAGGETFSIIGQFMHDSFSIELYNANGRKVASGSGWGTPDQPIEWK